MITTAKNYTKKKNMDKQKPRTNGKSKAIPTKSHKEAYTYTLTKRHKNGIHTWFSDPARLSLLCYNLINLFLLKLDIANSVFAIYLVNTGYFQISMHLEA